MNRRVIALAILHLTFSLLASGASAEETSEASGTIKMPAEGTPQLFEGTFSLSTSSPGTEVDESADAMGVPDEFEENLVTLSNPPMKIGATGDRVRELQATLNEVLGGQDIKFESRPIYIGKPNGTSTTLRDKVQKVWAPKRRIATQIKGDWVPVGDKSGDDKSDDEQLRRVTALRLPKDPLTVDGVYGQHTQAAVMLFQLKNRLPVTGEVDAVTLDKLEPMIPTKPLLAMIMRLTQNHTVLYGLESYDNYPMLVKASTSILATMVILLGSTLVFQWARMFTNSTRFLSRWLFTPASSPWFNALREKSFFLRLAQFAPAIFIYLAARIVFPTSDPNETDPFPYLNTFQDWQVIVSRLGLTYISVVFIQVALACADACSEIYNPSHEEKNPISGVIGAAKRFVLLIGVVLISASLAGKSPLVIIGGLGAFMAVIMLVFRDYLLGLVASLQIISHKIIKLGDWIEMPDYNADGDVKSISLNLVKVQNFDKTISTIPTHALLSSSFRNWSGMQAAGGRRIKRAIYIDLHSIQVCTPEMIERFKDIELIQDYVVRKCKELRAYNSDHAVEESAVNSRRLTNIGTFRAYLEAYLDQHTGLSDEMTFLVRHLPPSNLGLPIEIYAFCVETDWAKYEAVQADIFDHVLAVLPEFGLRAFQEFTDIELITETPDNRRNHETPV